MESLLLSCGALASPTMCRFIPALSDHKSFDQFILFRVFGCGNCQSSPPHLGWKGSHFLTMLGCNFASYAYG